MRFSLKVRSVAAYGLIYYLINNIHHTAIIYGSKWRKRIHIKIMVR